MSSAPTALPAAIFWDMDGTLVDTEPYWFRAEKELVEAWGGSWGSADFLAHVGQGLGVSALSLRERGVDLDSQTIISLLTESVIAQIAETLPWRPGALELLTQAHRAGIPQALVTMSFRRLVKRIVQALAKKLGEQPFAVIVTGDEVAKPKPDPEAYLRAAELLRVNVAECVAFEDSLPGVASAVASGAKTYAVPFQVEIPGSEKYTLLPEGLVGLRLSDLTPFAVSGLG